MPDKFDPTTELTNRVHCTLAAMFGRVTQEDRFCSRRVLEAALRSRGIHVYVDGVRVPKPSKRLFASYELEDVGQAMKVDADTEAVG